MVRHFRELRVYQDAFGAAMIIFQLSRSWPQEERYSLTDQIRRASRAVSANIAEAWRKRRYPAHFTSKLSDADSETAETQAWLDFAHSCGYLTKKDFSERKEVVRTRQKTPPRPHPQTPTLPDAQTPTLLRVGDGMYEEALIETVSGRESKRKGGCLA
jgi:four helix bundle protein